jgi:hypothetical protein
MLFLATQSSHAGSSSAVSRCLLLQGRNVRRSKKSGNTRKKKENENDRRETFDESGMKHNLKVTCERTFLRRKEKSLSENQN